MAIIKETIPFNFDEIYNGIAAKFAEKGYDSPYDGSNLAQLITSMAYTTSMLNANTAANINETILSLARKRPNIIQDARMLGYEAVQKISYTYEIELIFDKTKNYTIPKYTEFSAGSNKYYYMDDDIDYDATEGDILKIRVKEGVLHKYADEPENLKQIVANLQYFDIPYTDVEENGIEVFVTNYTQEGILMTKTKYKKSETLLMDISDKLSREFVRVEDIHLLTPRIYFVLSGVGNPIPRGSIIEFNVLVSKGEDGIMTVDPTTTIEDITIRPGYREVIVKGNTEETNQSIKENAPLLHNTAGRVVTANDYIVIARKHPSCKEAFIFGGEDEHPKRLGNIYFALTPEKVQRTFSNDSENTEFIYDFIENDENNYLLPEDFISTDIDIQGNIVNPGIIDNIRMLNLPALEYNIRNPIYIYLDFNINIKKYAISTNKKIIRENIFGVLSDYIATLETFETEFFLSNVTKRLDGYLTDVTGLDIDVNFQIMLDKHSIAYESIPFSCPNPDPTDSPYLANPAIEFQKEYMIHLYLETPYEGIYNNDNFLILDNLPKIDTTQFINGHDLHVDFSTYAADTIPDALKNKLEFDIYVNSEKVGVYSIYNDRKILIEVKIFCKDDDSFPVPGYTQIHNDYFDTPRYLDIVYPSKNFKTIRNSIFKLRKLNII